MRSLGSFFLARVWLFSRRASVGRGSDSAIEHAHACVVSVCEPFVCDRLGRIRGCSRRCAVSRGTRQRIAARPLHASGFVERWGGLLAVCCLSCGSVEVEVHKRPRSVWLVVSRPRVTGPLEQGVPT